MAAWQGTVGYGRCTDSIIGYFEAVKCLQSVYIERQMQAMSKIINMQKAMLCPAH